MLAPALAGCADDAVPEPAPAPATTPTRAAPLFDAREEPAQAVLALVPISAEVVTVTDWDTIRAQLGVPDLTSDDLATDRSAFWERAEQEAPLLAQGLLRPQTSELLLDHGFTQDDVDWEAHFRGPDGAGWVLALRPDLDPAGVRGAIDAGVGELDGARLLAGEHLVVSGTADPGDPVWGSEPQWDRLVGEPAAATYLHRGCVPLTDALGPDAGAAEVDAVTPEVTGLDDLPGFAVGFGDHNATVRVEPGRDDLFARIDLGEAWPVPGFGAAFRSGVGDPATGRMGYDVPHPPLAARASLLEELPFGVCPEVTPVPEPTG